jgi:hypothetical protein
VECPVDEVGNDITVSAGYFARTINIEVASYSHRQAIIVIEEIAVEFAEKLGDLIRGVKVKRNKVFPEW